MTRARIGVIAILGAGSVGQALGAGLARAGRSVIYGVRGPAADNEDTVGGAAARSDIIILATPFDAVEDVLAAAGECAGKIVIDCTNPLRMRDGRLGLAIGFSSSGAETIAAKLPKARVVKTLNQTGAENMGDAHGFATRPIMFVAGDDDSAIESASELVRDLGFDPAYAGPLSNARLLEPLAMLWIDQALYRGAGRSFAFARQQR